MWHLSIAKKQASWAWALVAIAAAALVVGCGGGGGGGAPADNITPTVQVGSYTRLLPATGGTLTIDATATDNVGIARVEVRITAPNSQVTTLVAHPTGRGVYTVSYSAPANPGTIAMVYRFTVFATDTSGNVGSDVEYTFQVPSAETPPPRPFAI